ncbi:hypothetical protein [Paenibacillus antibioticophila]|uniref:hypothetical protein n=1 Tax=Paenibacillus antibioticophila TaxID=1274374 RepID=UPI0005CA3BC1|nr:hypothetical protein [Paenibacillus antibioticophila]
MCDIPDNFDTEIHQLIETISGKWLMFPKAIPLGTFFIDIEENFVLGVHKADSNICVYIPDENGVYQHVSNIAFQSNEDVSTICVNGSGIKDIRYDLDDRYNPTAPLRALFVDLEADSDQTR